MGNGKWKMGNDKTGGVVSLAHPSRTGEGAKQRKKKKKERPTGAHGAGAMH
jgi:hypothetical protein